MTKHNSIDIDGNSIMVDTPFYKWLVINQKGGVTYSSLLKALKDYLNMTIGKDFITNHQHWCYKCILEKFVESEVL